MEQNPLTPDQAILYLKARYNKSYQKSYLAKLRSVGGSAPFYKIGSSVLYDQIDLDKWIRENRTPKAKSTTQADAIKNGFDALFIEGEKVDFSCDDGWIDMD